MSTPSTHVRSEAPRPDLSRFLDLSAQILCITDLTSTVVWCNAAFERVLGYGVNDLLGVRLDDLLHPDDAAQRAALEPLPTDGTEGESGLCVLRFRGRDGRWRFLEWTTRIDLARERLYGVARDITDRRQDEAALSDSEARLAAILKYSPSVIFVKDLDGRYLMVNDEFARATGVSMEDAVGADASTCWPQDTEQIAWRERELLDGGTSVVSHDQLHTVDGPREFMVHRFLLRDERGTPYAIGSIASDVTVRMGAEKALLERDRLLDSVIRASPDMITLMDRGGKIHQISEAESTMFGHRHEVFAETGLFEFVHPDDFDDVASMFVRMVTGAVSHLHLRYRVRHADGHWVVVDSRARAVLDAEGHFAGAVVVSRDVSDKLESEQKLKASREAAEQASRAKSDFLSRMSHELRTPLNSILGFAQLLQMDELPGQSVDAVEHILRAGRHLLDLIDEVLDIARIEAGHLELAMAAVSMTEIVAEAVELTSPIAARADVTIRTAGTFGGNVVTADRQRLMQVLLNLVSNAVKYNQPGGRVDISCEPFESGFVRLSVADTGRGIRAEDLDRVFVPFDRLGVEQSGIEGTGVGLALSHHLCERMGGRLLVESVPDVGSTFFVDLPVGDPEALAAARDGRFGVGASASITSLRGATASRSWISDSPGARAVSAAPAAPETFAPRLPEDVATSSVFSPSLPTGSSAAVTSSRPGVPGGVGGAHRDPPRADARRRRAGDGTPADSAVSSDGAGTHDDAVTDDGAVTSDGGVAVSRSPDTVGPADPQTLTPNGNSDRAPDDESTSASLQGPFRATVRPKSLGRTFRVLLIEDNLTTLDLVERVLSRRPGTEVLASMQGGLGIDLAREHTPDLVLLDLQLPDMSGNVVLDRLADDPATAAIPVAVVGADAPAPVVRQLLQQGIIGFLEKPIDVRGLLSLVDAVRAARGT